MTRIAILGAGMAGFGAAHRLNQEGTSAIIYDKNPYHGGHTASFRYDNGFIFDEGPHISFTKDGRIRELFADSVGQEYETFKAYVNNYWRGHWLKHPAQCNLYGLPTDLVVAILCDFIKLRAESGPVNNYEDWLRASFGDTFAETFPMEYGLKYHTTTAGNMSTDWLGPRLYKPSLEEVLQGALSPKTSDVHYIGEFRYPKKNGFVSFLNGFLDKGEFRLNHKVVRIDPWSKEIVFSSGTASRYDSIISSIPLPKLIPMICGVPEDVLQASQRLAATTCVIVNVGINREDISEAHWTYFYDRDIFFTRLSFPHMLSRGNVPEGAGSIQAEVYYSEKYRPVDRQPAECVEPVIRDLRRCGLLREEDKVLFSNFAVIPFANVIFDLDRAAALATVHGFLNEVGISYCGRYGEWGYLWTDDSFISGENAAQKVLDRMSSRS
jgi:protoporphyrinogen oxidase